MIRRLIILLLIVGCVTEPDDCAGVIGGSAYLDNCNVCDNDPTNDCIQDCIDVWGGDAVEDECGVCNGTGIPEDNCDCDGNILDCEGICGGEAVLDECIIGTWIAVNLETCGIDNTPPSDVCLIFYENNTFEKGCCGCEENQPISGTWSVEDDELYLSGDDFDTILFSSLDEDILVFILDISWWEDEEEPCLSNPTMIYTFHWYLNGDIIEWICTTDYFSPNIAVPDSTDISGLLEEIMLPDTVLFFENIIYDSIDECQSVCPNEPLEITTTISPDGTGEYFSMYCAGN